MTSNEIKKKRVAGLCKRRLRREREQAGPKVDSYRKTARLRLQERCLKAGFGNKRQVIKRTLTHETRSILRILFETYKRQFRYFADWLSEAHKEAYTIADARPVCR